MSKKNLSTAAAPKVILGVVAHPDDLEFCAGGSIAAWANQGAEVYCLILTNGNNGTADRTLSPEQLRKTRQQEQQDAAQILGIKKLFFCDYDDCGLEVSVDVKRDIVRIIRQTRPDTVFTLDPTFVYSSEHGIINHSDHRAAGQATLDAVYPLARDHLAFPELLEKEQLQPHKVAALLLSNFDKSNFFVDITDTMDKKLAALAAHTSQFPDMDALAKTVQKFGKTTGAFTGTTYAEGFMRIDIAP